MSSIYDDIVFKYALQNALKYGGKAKVKPVLNVILAEYPQLRPSAREILTLVEKAVKEVNSMSLTEQKRLAEEKYPEILVEKATKEERKGLPPLPRANEYPKIRTRFAPNPDFDIHLGNARAAILSFEYARMYNGDFILRFEDTDPRIKAPVENAYEVIRDNLQWLGLKWKEEYIQSLRMEIYYEYATKLLETGGGYICMCPSHKISEYRARGIRCEHFNHSIEENLELWDRMLEGEFREGEIVLRVKTDPKFPDPSVRDWIAFRIIDSSKYPHPLVGDKYIVWPTYNFACAIDDHLMNITHVLRAKEHEANTPKQEFLYAHFKWKYPVTIHFGKLKLEGVILSKSKIKKGIEIGKYRGWNDLRLATLTALRRRGILPETIWKIILDVGIKPVEAKISLVNLYAINRSFLEPRANRYMFVKNPVVLVIYNCTLDKAILPYHPSFPERGFRTIEIGRTDNMVKVFIPEDDARKLRKNCKLRLLGLCNVKIVNVNDFRVESVFMSTDVKYAKKERLPIIQWCPENSVRVEVEKAVGDELVFDTGIAEPEVRKLPIGYIVQFIRYGFVKLEKKGEYISMVYVHN